MTMHYKNGRDIKVDEIVVGRTHNSEGYLRVGVVLELMPAMGPCNVKLMLLGAWSLLASGAAMLKTTVHFDGKPLILKTGIDYADAKELYRIDDCYGMLDAVMDHGGWDSPYMRYKLSSDSPTALPVDND